MKKIGKIALAIVILIIVASSILKLCNGKRHEVEEKKFNAKVKPETTVISGDLSDYLQIVDNEYEVTNDMMYNISIKIKAIKPLDRSTLKNKDIALHLSLLGENGSPISEINQFSPYGGDDNIITLLTKGSGEDVIKFIAVSTFQKADPAKVKKFSVSSTIKDKEKETASQSSSESATDADGPTEYNEMLDAYEKNTDDYIKMAESMDKNDVSGVIGKYASVVQSTMELEKKLKAAKSSGKMTANQMSRMLKIQSKMLAAMEKSNSKK